MKYSQKFLFNACCFIKLNKMDLSGMRKPYCSETQVLLEGNIKMKNPFDLFECWFTEAKEHKDVIEPNAVCLSTATKCGMPSSRYMLCKGFGKEFGFKFFTNFGSKKGRELEHNPHAALCFFWEPLKRQVRVEGKVEKLPMSEAEEYFKSRPYNSQIGALLSKQSYPVEGRHIFEQLEKELMAKYPEGSVPKPETWGGFKLIPNRFEFWQGQTNRIHDRFQFRKPKPNEVIDEKMTHPVDDDWVYERLYP